MRTVVGLVLGIIVGVSGYVVNINSIRGAQSGFASPYWLQHQQAVLNLLDNVCEDSINTNITQLAKEFSIQDFLNDDQANLLGINKEAVAKFKQVYGTQGEGLTQKEDAFYELNSVKLDELQAIYGIFYQAKDFYSFYQIASWARQNVNCEVFVTAFYTAILNRKDTTNLSVPPPYQVLPHYFFTRDSLAKAILIYRNKDVTLENVEGLHGDGNIYTVDTNYTGAFFDNDDESKLSYFREDVGLNSFYFFTVIRKAPWVSSVMNIKDNGLGDFWYYITRQLNARYNLERVTNGLEPVKGFRWENPINTEYTYDPLLINRNGTYFPARNNVFLDKSENVAKLNDLLSTFKKNIDNLESMDKTVRMNTVLDFLTSANTHYDFLARSTLGKDAVDEGDISRSPSALQHYSTTLRDPVFWRLNKHYLDIFNEVLNGLEPYAYNQLYFPGVEILNIDVKKMQTYFDYNEFEITNSIKESLADNIIHVNIGQPRLNHKPFSILINVVSLISKKALVKIFIGPKFNPTEIAAHKDTLKQLDSFEYHLKIGTNAIVRKSSDIKNIVDDFVSTDILQKSVEAAVNGFETLTNKNIESVTGFPSRVVLPKGTSDGFALQLYVIVAPLVKSQIDGPSEPNTETLSLSYPFDRPIKDPKLFDLANTMFKDIVITHKGDTKVYKFGGEGASKKWYSSGANTYNPDDKKLYDYKSKKDSYNYKEKSGSYDYNKNKETYDYASKKEDYSQKKYDYKNSKNIEPVHKSEYQDEGLEIIPIEPLENVSVIPISTQVREKTIGTDDNNKNKYSKSFDNDKNWMTLADKNEKIQNLNLLLQSKSPLQKYKIDNSKNIHNKKNKEKKEETKIDVYDDSNDKNFSPKKLNENNSPVKISPNFSDKYTKIESENPVSIEAEKITQIITNPEETITAQKKEKVNSVKTSFSQNKDKNEKLKTMKTDQNYSTGDGVHKHLVQIMKNKEVDIEDNTIKGKKTVKIDGTKDKDNTKNTVYITKAETVKPKFDESSENKDFKFVREFSDTVSVPTHKPKSDYSKNNFNGKSSNKYTDNKVIPKKNLLRSIHMDTPTSDYYYDENSNGYEDAIIDWVRLRDLTSNDRPVYY